MDNFLLGVYLDQVKRECELCFSAMQAFDAVNSTDDRGGIFQHALALVHHAAAVSRIFWPPKAPNKHVNRRAQRRGEFLRGLLGLQDGHAVQNRTLRDHFEHFDERLDDWAEKSKNRSIINRFIGPRGAIGGIDDTEIIHHFDPATGQYAFRGEKFDLVVLANGIHDIYNRINNQLDQIELERHIAMGHRRVG